MAQNRVETMKGLAAKRKAALAKKVSIGAKAGDIRYARKLLKRAQRRAHKLAVVQARLAPAAPEKPAGGES